MSRCETRTPRFRALHEEILTVTNSLFPDWASSPTMPGPMNTLLIEGSFEELSDELAQYIEEIKKKQGENGASLRAEITPFLEQGQKDEALKKLVTGSIALNGAPEKGP